MHPSDHNSWHLHLSARSTWSYRSESYGPPPIAAGIVYDTVAWFSSVEKLRGIAEEKDATVVFGHDPAQLTELRTGVGNYYT